MVHGPQAGWEGWPCPVIMFPVVREGGCDRGEPSTGSWALGRAERSVPPSNHVSGFRGDGQLGPDRGRQLQACRCFSGTCRLAGQPWPTVNLVRGGGPGENPKPVPCISPELSFLDTHSLGVCIPVPQLQPAHNWQIPGRYAVSLKCLAHPKSVLHTPEPMPAMDPRSTFLGAPHVGVCNLFICSRPGNLAALNLFQHYMAIHLLN